MKIVDKMDKPYCIIKGLPMSQCDCRHCSEKCPYSDRDDRDPYPEE